MNIAVDTIVTISSLVTAVVVIFGYYNKVFKWVEEQNKQGQELDRQKEELAILTFGVLSCLRGLKEQGCDGPVLEGIDKIEKFLNKKAHDI